MAVRVFCCNQITVYLSHKTKPMQLTYLIIHIVFAVISLRIVRAIDKPRLKEKEQVDNLLLESPLDRHTTITALYAMALIMPYFYIAVWIMQNFKKHA